MRRKINLLALLFTIVITGVTFAKSDNTDQKDTPEEVKSFIKHHLKDAHYFELFHGVKMPLPIIFWDNGVHIFLSSDFKKVEVKEVITPDSTITFSPLSESDTVAKEITDYLYESKRSNHSIFHGKIVAAKHGDMLLKLNSNGKKKHGLS